MSPDLAVVDAAVRSAAATLAACGDPLPLGSDWFDIYGREGRRGLLDRVAVALAGRPVDRVSHLSLALRGSEDLTGPLLGYLVGLGGGRADHLSRSDAFDAGARARSDLLASAEGGAR